MACIFGHKWNGCKCTKCGKTRDSDHSFIKIPNECKSKCSICGGVKNDEHLFITGNDDELVCSNCGTKILDLSMYSSSQIDQLIEAIRNALYATDKNAQAYGISLVNEDNHQFLSQFLVDLIDNQITYDVIPQFIETFKVIIDVYEQQLEIKKIAGTLNSDEAKNMQTVIQIYTDLASRCHTV